MLVLSSDVFLPRLAPEYPVGHDILARTALDASSAYVPRLRRTSETSWTTRAFLKLHQINALLAFPIANVVHTVHIFVKEIFIMRL